MTLILEFLHFTPTVTEVALTSRPTYELQLLYGILTTVVHTFVCLFDTGAAINLIRSKMILQKWANCIK